MMFGDKNRFGVEVLLDANHGGEWLFGKYCYWVGGREVGRLNLGTSLRDVLIQSDSLLRDAHRREHQELFREAALSAAPRIRRALYGSDSIPREESERANLETWARFDIAPRMDVFDGWFVFLIEHGQAGRLLVVDPSQVVHEAVVAAGECDSILRRALAQINDWLEGEQAQPSTPPAPAAPD